MKRITYFVFGCCCVILGTITGCSLLDPAQPPDTSDRQTASQTHEMSDKADVVTRDDNIHINSGGGAPSDHQSSHSPCTSASAKAIARAYLLSVPLRNDRINLAISDDSQLTQYVQHNHELFAAHGAATQCAAALGEKVTSFGEQAYLSSTDMQKSISGNWGGSAAAIAAKAADTLQSHGASMFTLGEEMLWLAKVLPDVANGQLSGYNAADSNSRSLLKQAVQTQAASEITNADMTNENLSDLLNNTANQYLTPLEDQIILLAGTLQIPDKHDVSQQTAADIAGQPAAEVQPGASPKTARPDKE